MNFSGITRSSLLIAVSILVFSCSGETKDEKGKNYRKIGLGKQVWMSENLSVSGFRNGDSIPEAKTAEEWMKYSGDGKAAWCHVMNDPENDSKYGRLYNWFAVSDPRGLAPKGWHIPSYEEWREMINYLGGDIPAALKIRESGSSVVDNETSNLSFSALPGGNRSGNGIFYGQGSYIYWWSSTEINSTTSYILLLNFVKCEMRSLSMGKPSGLSVRCVKN
jgi:uncharacterized protein (TIGR02145 family)